MATRQQNEFKHWLTVVLAGLIIVFALAHAAGYYLRQHDAAGPVLVKGGLKVDEREMERLNQ